MSSGRAANLTQSKLEKTLLAENAELKKQLKELNTRLRALEKQASSGKPHTASSANSVLNMELESTSGEAHNLSLIHISEPTRPY